MTKFDLKIVTPQGVYKEEKVDQVNLRTTAGQIGILAHHMPLASGIEISAMECIIDGHHETYAVAGGFVYVNDTETTIIANAIESQEEIDLDRAQEAKKRAEARLKQTSQDVDFMRAEVALKRAITRIHVKNM